MKTRKCKCKHAAYDHRNVGRNESGYKNTECTWHKCNCQKYEEME